MYYYSNYNQPANDDRFFFWVPFLLGGLGGAAIASTARPRPVYVTPYQQYNPGYNANYYPYGYNYYGGYNYNNPYMYH